MDAGFQIILPGSQQSRRLPEAYIFHLYMPYTSAAATGPGITIL